MTRGIVSLLLACALACVARGETRRFSFGSAAGAIPADAVFSSERGHGFEPGAVVTAGERFVASEKPFLFSVAVPEGNYLIAVTLGGDASTGSNTTIKTESRRLVVEQAITKPGETITRTFAVNVRNAKVPPPPQNAPGNDHVELNDRERANGPGGGLVLHWDDKLTLEFCGPHPVVSAIDITPAPELPTVFLAGDSTVTDQPREPGASWGQMLPRFFKPTIAIANHAESGETLKSFLTELRFDKLLGQMKRGDYLLVQFGHNDSKSSWPQTYVEAGTTYKAYLKVFIAEARRRGATPVLVTPVQRRQFDAAGKIRNSHGDYPAAVREVAREENVALIDLERDSAAFYEALGPEKSPLAFSAGGRDVTHHNNYGAYELAKCVAAGIRAARLDLAAHIIDDFTGLDPARPDPVEAFTLAPSAGRSNAAPRGN